MAATGGALAPTLLLIGVSVLAGFVGHALFRRFRVSDILFLFLVGFVLGPILGLIDATVLRPAMPILGPIGLALVLFEGGLELRWQELRRHGMGAVGFTLLGWSLTTLVLGVAAHAMLGYAWPIAFLLSCAVSATGIVAVIPLLAQVRAPQKARVWLTVETGLGDLLSAVAVVSLSAYLLHGGGPATLGSMLGLKFALGGAVGILCGIGWARVLFHLQERSHAYALTLAALLVSYALTEILGGSGYLCALVFGAVVGNAHVLMREGGLPPLESISQRGREHQGEIIFLLRSIYFVYLGLSMSRSILSPESGLAILVLTSALLVARLATVAIAHRRRNEEDRRAHLLMSVMMPRAMAAAVLASTPAALGVPGTDGLLAGAMLVIVGADVATTIGLWMYTRRHADALARPALVADPAH